MWINNKWIEIDKEGNKKTLPKSGILEVDGIETLTFKDRDTGKITTILDEGPYGMSVDFGEDEQESKKIITLDVDDPVGHPSHYNQDDMEVIDQMLLLFGPEKTMAFCELNAFKYRARAPYKHDDPDIDMQKAMWYIKKYKQIKENY